MSVIFRGPLPQVCNPDEYLIWLHPGSSAVPSSVSWKSAGHSGPSRWQKLIYTSEVLRIPLTTEGYDVGKGNKWWRYQREACLLWSSPPASSSGSDSTVQSSCRSDFTDILMRNMSIWNELDLDITGNPSEILKALASISSFNHYLNLNVDCWRERISCHFFQTKLNLYVNCIHLH